MKFDLEVLRVRLLSESQTVNLTSSAFNVFVISARPLPSRKTLVSSANIKWQIIFRKHLEDHLYRVKRRGRQRLTPAAPHK